MMLSAEFQTMLAGAITFTLVVLILSLVILGVQKVLAPGGNATLKLNDGQQLTAGKGTKILDLLADNGIYLPAACGGQGMCGQCRVKVLADIPHLTAIEASHIARPEAEKGIRLACTLSLRRDLEIRVPDQLLNAKRWQCKVESSRCITTLMKEVVLALPEGEHIDFHAGAYILVEAPPYRLRFEDFAIDEPYRREWQRHSLFGLNSVSGEACSRAYSLSNPPADSSHIILNVRIALPPADAPSSAPPGKVSSWLFGLAPGDPVFVSGPFGEFRASETASEMVLIGGGAGIAPLRSIMLDQLSRTEDRRTFSLWYGARNALELCYKQEFDVLAGTYEHFRWMAALSAPTQGEDWDGPTGFIHQVVLEHYLKDHPAPFDLEYYICGPPLMNVAVVQMLEDLGVEPEQIFLDDFGGYS